MIYHYNQGPKGGMYRVSSRGTKVYDYSGESGIDYSGYNLSKSWTGRCVDKFIKKFHVFWFVLFQKKEKIPGYNPRSKIEYMKREFPGFLWTLFIATLSIALFPLAAIFHHL